MIFETIYVKGSFRISHAEELTRLMFSPGQPLQYIGTLGRLILRAAYIAEDMTLFYFFNGLDQRTLLLLQRLRAAYRGRPYYFRRFAAASSLQGARTFGRVTLVPCPAGHAASERSGAVE